MRGDRIVVEYDECQCPGLIHLVHHSRTTQDDGVLYFTHCGMQLWSLDRKPRRKYGRPTCIECVIWL